MNPSTPQIDSPMDGSPLAAMVPPPPMNPFDFDLLLINQRTFSVADRYDVLDAWGSPRFHVRRELRMGGMAAAGMVRLVFTLSLFYVGFRLILNHQILAALIVFWATGFLADLVFLSLSPLRHVFIHLAGWENQPPILSISQDNRISLWRRFTLFDDQGSPVAQFVKAKWTNFYRRRWRVLTVDGQLICELLEDTWVRSIARRLVGPLFGLLKTDFGLLDPEGNLLGRYQRRWTILERYVLDLSMDPWKRLDRRVALAAGILLDTGERR